MLRPALDSALRASSTILKTAGDFVGFRWQPTFESPRQLTNPRLTQLEALEEELTVIGNYSLDADYVADRETMKARYVSLRERAESEEILDRLQREEQIESQRLFGRMIARTRITRTALCLSGGGIRSATFALGVLQGLAARGLLKQFDFLSTVSGGGYIGSWLTAWIHRNPDGMTTLEADLSEGNVSTVFRLREYSHYLAPRFGAFSADTWTLAVTYLRNLLVNWLVFVPFLIAVLAVPKLGVAFLGATPDPAHADVWILSLALAGLVLLGLVLIVMGLSLPGTFRLLSFAIVEKEGQFFVLCLIPFAVAGLLLSGAWGFAARHPGLAGPLVEQWIPWFQSRGWWAWFQVGAVFHLVVMLPALLARGCQQLSFLFRLVRRGHTVSTPPVADRSETFVNTYIQSAPAHLTRVWLEVWPGLQRILAIVLICGGLGGLLFRCVIAGYDRAWPSLAESARLPLYVMVGPPVFWLTLLLSGILYLGFISRETTDHEREWYARAGAWMLLLSVAWVVLSGISLFGPVVLVAMSSQSLVVLSSVGLGSTLFTIMAGRAVGVQANGPKRGHAGPRRSILNWTLGLAAPLCLVFVLSLLSLAGTACVRGLQHLPVRALGLDSLTISQPSVTPGFAIWGWNVGDTFRHLETTNAAGPALVVVTIALLLAMAWLVDFFADLGVFSLHAMYRDRLIRAYLAASRPRRKPNGFTGFDPNDNLPLVHLRPVFFSDRHAQGLAKIVTDCYEAPTWWRAAFSEPTIPPPPATPPTEDQIRELVMSLLADQGSELLLEIQAHGLSPDREHDLLRRWNALLARPELCVWSGATYATDPIGHNRRFLQSQEWFRSRVPFADPESCLFPVINTSLNLVGGRNLAWQQRKAESFFLTPLHAGSTSLGCIRQQWHARSRIRYYAGRTGVTLGTAMTISGAAANPNMGYHSSPIVTFLLTLFNARLGAWLGNPSNAHAATERGPRQSIRPIIWEAFGLTNERRDFVNLSDGGHFENLALYEMVRRRCSTILVVDGSQDQRYQFDCLGNAVSKIRLDLGIPIEFSPHIPIREPHVDEKGHARSSGHAAVARIRYSVADGCGSDRDGWLMYIKPGFDGTEPEDVRAYAKRDPDFPHQSTSNQFFNEMQFEAYRALGRHSIDHVIGKAKISGLAGLRARFSAHHRRMALH